MFTGIIHHIGRIESAQTQGDLKLTIACDWPESSLALGESIACNGACLTIIEKGTLPSGKSFFTVELSAETLTCTAPRWKQGDALNLERAMKLGDTLDGHMVSGHVDGIATIHSVTDSGDSHIVAIDAPAALSCYIAEKGSVTLDGVSLTVNKVEASRFYVNIIPHTWKVTTLGQRKAGDNINIEIDLIARYVARLLGRKETDHAA
jgi:riboflavin synthase